MMFLSPQRLFQTLLAGVLLGPVLFGAVSIGIRPGGLDGEALAPDGRPGFGAKCTAREVGKVFRSPTDQEEEFLKGLFDLTGEILVMREMARRTYLQRGYFKVLDNVVGAELDQLHRRFGELQQDADKVLAKGGVEAKRLADMLVDLRFQLRMDLLDVFEIEGPELRRGLGLLAGSQNGLYDLKDSEVRAIAKRVDLSAARLRAVRTDMDILRDRGEAGAPGSADPAWGKELLALGGIAGEVQRTQALRAVQKKINRRMRRLDSVLFLPRLDPRISRELDKRQALEDRAELHLERVKTYLLVPPFDQNPTQALLDMSRAERHQYAVSEGLRGLDANPLSAELTYWTGIGSGEILAPSLSRPWFDRFLALRGIRSDEQGTLKDRELTVEEKYALEQVMGAFLGPGPGGGPR